MATITIRVRQPWHAAALIPALVASATSQTLPLLERLEDHLPEAQRATWDKLGNVQGETAAQRALRRGYYKNPPSRRAKTTGPRFTWTGALTDATSKLTEKSARSATIKPDVNYSGPITEPNPFATFVDAKVPKDQQYDKQELRKAAQKAAKEWAEKDLAPAIRRRVE